MNRNRAGWLPVLLFAFAAEYLKTYSKKGRGAWNSRFFKSPKLTNM